jgi:hypothetical protein
MRFWVVARFLLVDASVWRAVIAEELVRRLDIGPVPL